MLQKVFGKNVKEIRLQNGISQLELSYKADIERTQLSRIENGSINVTLDTIEKLSSALNTPPSSFFSFHQEINPIIHPFVKWAGGKTQLISKLIEYMPQDYDMYFEPFVGGGALFFSILPPKAHINDNNCELITVYKCLQSDRAFHEMISYLREHEQKHNEDYYYEIRELDKQPNFANLPEPIRAARMIYLNKACFNGLYRVNSKGFFNVPSGKKKVVKTFEEENMNQLRKYFKNNKIKVTNLDFAESVKTALPNDFVYFDPPYDKLEDKNSFTSYTKDAFGKEEQKKLADVYKELALRGVKVMLSNHNTSYIRSLYKEFNIHIVEAKRIINSNPNGRGNVEEVIITNY